MFLGLQQPLGVIIKDLLCRLAHARVQLFQVFIALRITPKKDVETKRNLMSILLFEMGLKFKVDCWGTPWNPKPLVELEKTTITITITTIS